MGEIGKGPIEPGDLARPPRRRAQTQENLPLGRSSSFVYDDTTPRLSEVTTNDLSRFVASDAVGNETSYVATRTYSPRNLLAEVTDPGEPGDPLLHKLTYTYDGRGVRVIRAESPADGPNTTARRFSIYTPELQLLAVTRDDASNVWALSAGDKNIHYEIVWFAGRPIAQITPAGPGLYTFTDHLGTPILQTDSTATVTWRAEYEPFGNIWEMRIGKRTDQPLRFPGQEVAMNWEGQEENYNIHRWYRSGWGRYTQADPIGLGHTSLYSYALSNPSRTTDPLGLYDVVYNIVTKPHASPAQLCGSPIACTTVGGSLDCDCECDQNAGFVFANVTLNITGTMYIFNGPFGALKKTSKKDKSVKDAVTAEAHEYKYHINIAAAAVDSLIKTYEGKGFSSIGACKAECAAVNWKVTNLFAKTLKDTQVTENN